MDCWQWRLPELSLPLESYMSSQMTRHWVGGGGLRAAGEPGTSWRKSPGWAPSTAIPQFSRSLELSRTPAGQRGGVSDTADPGTTSPLRLIRIEHADSSTYLLGLELTAAHFLAVDKSLEQICLRRALAMCENTWSKPSDSLEKCWECLTQLVCRNLQDFHLASRFTKWLPMNRKYENSEASWQNNLNKHPDLSCTILSSTWTEPPVSELPFIWIEMDHTV